MDLNHYSIFSSDDRKVTSGDFTGGKMTAIFSELEMDLREATISMPPAILDVRILFAEVDLTVSNEWNVETRVSTPLCEFNDRRTNRIAEGDKSEPRPDLVLTGFGVISEVNLRD